jgi:hypothetical protein
LTAMIFFNTSDMLCSATGFRRSWAQGNAA